MDQSTAPLLVWFDGGCPLCRREIALMRRLDRRGAIAFVDASAADPASAGCPLDRSALLARFHALEDGRLLSGAAAFAAMWRAIPPLRPLGLAARSPAVLALLERGYRLFLRLRPRLQRLALRWDAPGRRGRPGRDAALAAPTRTAALAATGTPEPCRAPPND